MAVDVVAVRTDSMKARRERLRGWHSSNACELCLKILKGGGVPVMIDHETYEFVTSEEATARGEAVSSFLVGADCAKRIRKALTCTLVALVLIASTLRTELEQRGVMISGQGVDVTCHEVGSGRVTTFELFGDEPIPSVEISATDCTPPADNGGD